MEWFIIQEADHSGPYTERSLHGLIKKSAHGIKTQIWKEGWPAPLEYCVVFPNGGSDLPPDLPSDVIEKISVETLVDQPGPPGIESLKEPSYEREKNILDDGLSLNVGGVEKKAESNKKLYLILSFLTFLLIVGWFFIQGRFQVFARPMGMNLSDYKRLTKVVLSKEVNPVFSFAISHDKKKIWGASNIPYSGSLNLHFTSIKGKVLGEEVEFSVRGELERGLIKLNEYRFSKATKIIDGYYNVKIESDGALSKSLIQKISSPYESIIKIESEQFISSLKEYAFNKSLQIHLKKKEKNNNHFFVELKEKYRTVSVITEQIKNAIVEFFRKDHDRWEKNLSLFESNYKAQYGVFFTSFVTSNEESYTKLIKKEFEDKYEVISHYSKLSKLAKSIGGVTMEALHDLEAVEIKKIKPDDLMSIKNKTLNSLSLIIDECEEKIKSLEK